MGGACYAHVPGVRQLGYDAQKKWNKPSLDGNENESRAASAWVLIFFQ
jgi:hypothetical protein